MDVVSACPLRVASIAWQSGPGSFALTVVVVASFTLSPGESPLAGDQDAPNEADGYWNDDAHRSLHVASDLAPFKRRADVFVVGHAYAPGGEPISSLLTRLIVGDIDKSIAIYGDRVFALDGDLRAPARFVRMPLRWERAAGGPDTGNPVGIRADAAPDAQGMTPVPNLQPPATHVTMRGDFIEPIGYAPIAPTWPSRIAKLHRYASSWDPRRWNRKPLPSDIDGIYFNAAPPDQQIEELRGNERIVLENLHPEHARLVTNLQAVIPRAVIEREGGATEALRLRCDTLSIDTDRGRCSLVWRGAVALRHLEEAGRVVVTTDDVATSGGPSPMQPSDGPKRVQTLVGSQPVGEALPFVPSAGGPPPTPPPPPVGGALPFAPSAGAAPATPRPPSVGEALPFVPSAGAAAASPRSQLAPDTPGWALPFKATPQPLPPPPPTPPPTPPPPTPPPVSTTDVDVVPPDRLRSAPALPFVSGAKALMALPAPPAVPGLPSGLPSTWSVSPAIPPPAPPARLRELRAPPAAPITRQSAPITASGAPPQPLPAEEPPAPPPMIGPLATPEMYLKTPESAAPPPVPPPLAAPLPAPAAEPAKAGSGLPLGKYPLEKCAAIAASIARSPAERGEILEVYSLNLEGWTALDQHWLGAVRKETARGRSKLLSAYDSAYLGQLEAERGPIDVREYARIVVAAERGTVDPLFADLELPRAALLRIQRAWLRRLAEDANLSALARREVERVREEEE